MKLCSRKIASGSAKIECETQIGRNVPAQPASTYSVSSGIIVTWIGTICSEKTTTNSRLRPLKSTQAKAYAASSASTTGMSTEGIVMMKELMKALPSADDPSVVRTAS
jgi:hypothetical protein